jgi:hypothetical protein
VRRREAGGGGVPLEVDADDGVPLGLADVEDQPVAQDAGVVDEDVELAVGVDRGVDQPSAVDQLETSPGAAVATPSACSISRTTASAAPAS